MSKENKYLAFDGINGDHVFCATPEEAKEFTKEFFLEAQEGYHSDLKSCGIYKLCYSVDYDVIDERSNYKYESIEEAEEAEDIEAIDNEDYWPHSVNHEAVWEHKFIKHE